MTLTEKELVKKLNNLKGVAPAADWKKSNREILSVQLAGTRDSARANWLDVMENILPETMLLVFSRPAAVFAAVAILVFGGGALSLKAAADTKPGDSLYIAKIVSEKTQLALTFNTKAKTKLNLEFATNRLEEASKVLAEAAPEQEKAKQLDELASNFNKEISAVKSRLAKDNPKANGNDNSNNSDNINTNNEDSQIFGASLEKSDQGLDVSAPVQATTSEQAATSTTAGAASLSSTELALDAAQNLFAQKDFQASLDKLKEASALISGETVPAASSDATASSTATSTDASTAASTATTTPAGEGSATSTK